MISLLRRSMIGLLVDLLRRRKIGRRRPGLLRWRRIKFADVVDAEMHSDVEVVEHVDLAMTLLRERQTRYPVSFGKYTRAILDSVFYQSLIFALNDYKRNPTNFKFENYLINYTNGTWRKFGRNGGCTHLYFPICYNKHWIAAEVVFETSEVNIYDPDKGCLTEGQLNQCLEPVTVILPLLAQQVGIKINGPLKVVRSDKTSKQGTS
ncbi:hypothetical protein DH2020_041226 [Rehmannia glutinosa]|uniref:Ubiquitin-like protease family profile domain-containing protein n=1 Tax=Rehmannia glutinosa TaxID=99300 RepID=A0ABR0UQU6_REHGL